MYSSESMNPSFSVVEEKVCFIFVSCVCMEGPMAGLRFPVVADSDGQLSRSFGILHLKYVGHRSQACSLMHYSTFLYIVCLSVESKPSHSLLVFATYMHNIYTKLWSYKKELVFHFQKFLILQKIWNSLTTGITVKYLFGPFPHM